MSIIKDIKNNTLVICENNYKNYILKELTKNKCFLNVKFYTKKEFFKEYLFKYDEKTICYLIEKYNYKIEIAKMYLNNLYFVQEEKNYKSEKLNFLVELKKELISNNLLIYNDKFKENIKKYQIILLGYPYLEKYESKILQEVNAKIIDKFEEFKVDKIYEFEKAEDEINFVCKKICELLNKGINVNKIKLAGITDDYYNDLKRIFNFYNIPIKIGNGESLYSNNITQKFLDNYCENLDESINKIKNDNYEIVNKIIEICNKYTFCKNLNIRKKMLVNEFKNTNINNFKLKNYIEIVDILDNFEDKYVFLMNFNTGSIPKTFKDEEYITDDIKEEIDENKILEKNKKYKEFTINKIKSIKNLTISYKLKNTKNEFYPSSLINDLNLEVIKLEDNLYESYSYIYDKIKFAKLEDNYQKYGSINENYFIYKNNLKDISYKSYNNKFTGIDKELLKEYLNNKLVLSYSSLNNFNKCAFRYYLANILKLDKYEESFETFIGSLFHDVLEKCFINNLIVEEEIENYIKNCNKELTIKEKFFVNKITDDIKFVIKVLNEQKKNINLDKALYEKNIVIDKSNDYLVEFTGFIDKILYKENDNNTLISIIDYKTGYIDIELKYLPYGLSLQLPIYLYLVKKSNLFKNPKFVGFYLQYILDKDITRDISKNYEDERYNNLKLMGYSNCDIHALVEFDNNYVNSSLIKGMKTKVNGDFSSYSKVLNDNEIEKIIELTEKNIDNAIDYIINGKFEINPKKIGYEKDIGCMYCKFKDICNKKENDYEILEDIKSLEFLKEENN